VWDCAIGVQHKKNRRAFGNKRLGSMAVSTSAQTTTRARGVLARLKAQLTPKRMAALLILSVWTPYNL
jgi:hypothetical protein